MTLRRFSGWASSAAGARRPCSGSVVISSVGCGASSRGSRVDLAAWRGEVGAGDLQAVEEEASAAGIDLVAGDAAEDFADGELDGGAVFGHGEVEEGGAGLALARVLDRAAGGVVVVAEVFLAQAWAAAAVAVGEDVAALVAFGLGHLGTPPGVLLVLKSSNDVG